MKTIVKTKIYTIKYDIDHWVCGSKEGKFFDEILRELRYDATEYLLKYLGRMEKAENIKYFKIKDTVYKFADDFEVDYTLIAERK